MIRALCQNIQGIVTRFALSDKEILLTPFSCSASLFNMQQIVIDLFSDDCVPRYRHRFV